MESLEHNNQSWTKMLRKMDVTMSSFKLKLLKALLTTNTPPPRPPQKHVEIGLDHFSSRLNNFDQGGAREGAIAVPNPRDRRFVGKKVQSSQHFLFQD